MAQTLKQFLNFNLPFSDDVQGYMLLMLSILENEITDISISDDGMKINFVNSANTELQISLEIKDRFTTQHFRVYTQTGNRICDFKIMNNLENMKNIELKIRRYTGYAARQSERIKKQRMHK